MMINDSVCKEKNTKIFHVSIRNLNDTFASNKNKRKFNKTQFLHKIMMMMCTDDTMATTSLNEFLKLKTSMARNATALEVGAAATATTEQTRHMTLKGAFENAAKTANTNKLMKLKSMPATEMPLTTKRINKQKLQLQQKQQQTAAAATMENSSNKNNALHSTLEKQQQPNISTTDLAATRASASTTTAAAFFSHKTAAATTEATKTTADNMAKDVENAQNKTQCDVVCISSKGSPKQKCTHQQKLKQNEQQEQEEQQQQQQQQHSHPHHCLSANISRCNNISSSNIGIDPQTNNIANITSNIITNTTTISNITTAIPTPFSSTSSCCYNIVNKNIGNIVIMNKSTTKPTAPTKAAAAPTASTTAAADCIKAHLPLRRLCQHAMQMESMLRAVMFSFVFIMSLQYQSVAASTSMMTKHEPMFISRSETFKFVAGDIIVLPCEVANTDPYVVAWKRGIAILTAGSVKVTPDPRVRLINGFNLQIRDAVPQDAGDYICQIATMEPREITHTVEILVPPRIHHISTSGHLQVKKGSSVRIECSASGNPTPNVTWSRKNNILPNGEEKLHSHILSIENVDRHKGGVYICTANNGVGQPASSQVVLHVLYPPEITVERPVVFSGEGHEAMLVCIVHGETQPEVIWFKDTMQLDTTERHIMENRGSRHTLIIRKVHPQDFGNYSCVAENQLGKSRKTLQLSGKPNVAVFNSPPISQYKDRYNISWTVESHAPIEEYKLSFRRLQQGQEVDNSIDSHSASSSSSLSSSSSMLQMYGGGGGGGSNGGSMGGGSGGVHNYRLGGISSLGSMSSVGGYGSYGAGNVIHWGRNDWRDVVLPAIPISHHYTQGMSYMIRGLDPDQHYEATVQARNRYGWSEYSQSFVFSTSSNDNEMRDLSVTFYGGGSSRQQAENCLILAVFSVLYIRYLTI